MWKAQFLDGEHRALGLAKNRRPNQRLQAENDQLKKLVGKQSLGPLAVLAPHIAIGYTFFSKVKQNTTEGN